MEAKEAQAKQTAAQHVINMLRRPGQLEKVELYKRRISHKKASVEALLKTAMQSQLDDVRVGLNQLKTSLLDIKEIETSMGSMAVQVNDVLSLYNKLQDVHEENMKHSQYAIAMDNLKHIFTVPESVEKTKQWINEGKLLHTHQCLSDLENSRNDLLLELHKLPNQSAHDKLMLKTYFSDVEMLSNMLEKQIHLILGRTLNTVRKEPTVIVTVLRIVEREEKLDQEALKLQKQTGFLPPGRPKQWRKKAMEILETSIATRIEGTQVEEREDNKLWLVRYLELIRQLILEDLRVVKTLCVPCFPPSYDVLNKYVNMYHSCLSRHLQEIIQNGLEGNEYVSVLSWVMNTYAGPELMQNKELHGIDVSNIGPLLPPEQIDRLQEQYLKNMETNYIEWMQNTLKSEKQEWRTDCPPEEAGSDGYFRTAAPVIIFQMIDQNLQVTRTISQELTDKALLLSIDQVIKYGQSYKNCIIEFKNKHFEDRSQMLHFTLYMITIVNNCLQIQELSRQLQQQYWTPGSNDPLSIKFETVLNIYSNLRDEMGTFLLEEAFLDLDKAFDDIFTQRWFTAAVSPVDTICATLEDYFQDYCHLCEENFEYVITEAQNLVCKQYVSAMLQKKICFKVYTESLAAATKISKEVKQISNFFQRIAPNIEPVFDTILMLSEVLRCQDVEILSLDLHNLVDKYPDITEDHLQRLLSLRGDLTRSDIKEKVAFVMENRKTQHTVGKSVFKLIVFPDRIINW